MKKLLILVCMFPNLLAAQLHDNTWLMGYKGAFDPSDEFGITQFDFSDGTLKMWENNELYSSFSENNCVYSDSLGKPLAVFNGYWINDKSWQKMKGGDSMRVKLSPDLFVFGYTSDSDIPQGGLFLPWPGHSDSLLLFYVSQGNAGTPTFVELASLHLQYALINLSGNNRLGEVTIKRHIVLEDTIQYGRLSACKHANGRDWWLMINEINTNRWYRYLLDPDGLHSMGQQSVGAPMMDGIGQSVFSPNGRHYASFNAYDGINDLLHVYDFDRCTGTFLNHRIIQYSGFIGGVAFSPNSKYLYFSYTDKLYQFDLDSPDLLESELLIGVYDGYINTSATKFYLPQLAPNNKIYICVYGTTKAMHIIHQPDEAGIACEFKQHSILLPVNNAESLTTNPFYRLGPLDGSSCDTLGLDNLPVSWWRSEQDTLDPLQVYFHDLSYYEPIEWQWSFGDPASGVNNSSLERHPQHVFSAPGTYEVCLMVGNVNARDTLCRMLTLGSSLAENPDVKHRIQVSPNPFDSRLSVAVSSPLAQAGVIRLFDQTGRLVMQERLSFGITELNTGHLPPGMYFYSISVREEPVKAGKVVKVRGE